MNLLRRIDFGNEAGDDVANAAEILEFFVEQEKFSKYIDPRNRIVLAKAKKGVGKSAAMKWIEARVGGTEESPLVISLKGADLVRSNFGLTSNLELPNDYIRDWMKRICAVINRKIGAELSVAITDDEITMVESAEIDGFKSRNILSALTERLQKLIPNIEKNKQVSVNDVELLKRYSVKEVWVLVDDLDATYQRTEKENLELSTFFSACRYLVSEIGGIVFRATMRTDVWTSIIRYDESLDKFEQYVSEIKWNRADFRRLLAKRIESQMTALGISDSKPPSHVSQDEIEEHLINHAFEKRIDWGGDTRRTYQVLYTLAYHRPRWAIQLCKLAQESAQDFGETKINKNHIDAVWGPYGKRRIADLVAEHKHQCRNIEELVDAFRGAERRMTRDKLCAWIKNRIIEHTDTVIEGRQVLSPIDVAHYLYRLGFIVARIEDEDGEYFQHYSYDDMPDFLSSRTNDDFGAIWEIHPCYREALNIKKLSRRRVPRK